MIRPTKLGVSIASLSFLFYLVSLQTQSGLLFLVLGVVAGCFVINAVLARRSVKHVSVAPPPRIVGSEKAPFRGSWAVRNDGKTEVGQISVSNRFGTLFHVSGLAAHEQVRATPDLRLRRRGVYPYRRCRVESAYPFGLVRSQRRLRAAGEMIVYPGCYACEAPPASGFEPMLGGGFSGRHRAASGESFHGVRPMAPGDPVKLVHWASSSKGLGLMVKEFDQELSGRVGLIVCAGGETLRTGQGIERVDALARAAGSLALAGLDQGHQVLYTELLSAEVLSIPPFAAGDEILERLARFEAPTAPVTGGAVKTAVDRLPRRASLCLVAVEWPADARGCLNELIMERRRVTVYLPLDECEPAQFPASVTVFGYESNSMRAL